MGGYVGSATDGRPNGHSAALSFFSLFIECAFAHSMTLSQMLTLGARRLQSFVRRTMSVLTDHKGRFRSDRTSFLDSEKNLNAASRYFKIEVDISRHSHSIAQTILTLLAVLRFYFFPIDPNRGWLQGANLTTRLP